MLEAPTFHDVERMAVTDMVEGLIGTATRCISKRGPALRFQARIARLGTRLQSQRRRVTQMLADVIVQADR